MREAQEREGLRLSLATSLPVLSGEPPKLDQPRLARMEFQTELGQTFLKLTPETLGFDSILKAHHKIVGVTDDDDVALDHFLAPDLHP